MTDQLDVLRECGERLTALIEPLTPGQLRQPAYPSEWTIAEVLSHLGSGAVIARMRLEAALGASPIDEVVMQSVRDQWDAKSPEDQAIAPSTPNACWSSGSEMYRWTTPSAHWKRANRGCHR